MESFLLLRYLWEHQRQVTTKAIVEHVQGVVTHTLKQGNHQESGHKGKSDQDQQRHANSPMSPQKRLQLGISGEQKILVGTTSQFHSNQGCKDEKSFGVQG
eukprot:TRINITY_DN1013_c0_g1_i19.p2 TRINITY_DN1013_c0_g1~~TRINITY_DN1013_c0_g1_i19.p2  ORF type:complete len:101 (+),score=4.55 TRINITY_DN1013_c0_g1_i19:96-398(+)